jgi:hypothetical protein
MHASMHKGGGKKLSSGSHHREVGQPPYGVWGHPPFLWELYTSSSVGMRWWDHLITSDDRDVGHSIHGTRPPPLRENTLFIQGLGVLGSVLGGSWLACSG